MRDITNRKGYLPSKATEGGNLDDAQWHGIYDAQVAVSTDPLAQGRVRLYIPQVLGTAFSAWATPMQPGLAVTTGQNVLCHFLGGNPNLPQFFLGLTTNDIIEIEQDAINTAGASISPSGLVLNANPYFIGNQITGWTGVGGTVIGFEPNADTNPPYTSGIEWTSTGTGGGLITESADPVLLTASQGYLVTAWVYYPLGGTVNLGIVAQNNSHSTIATVTNPITVAASAWTYISTVVNTPVGTVYGYPVVGPATSSLGMLFQAEAIQLISNIPNTITTSPYDQIVTTLAPTAWWKLTDGSGSLQAIDSSGNNHTGTTTNVTFDVPGINHANTAAIFDGATSKVTTAYNPTATALSVEAWVNLRGTVTGTTCSILANSNTATDHKGINLTLVSGVQPAVSFGTGSAAVTVTSPVAITANGWNHIVGTWNGTTATLYVNGIAVMTGAFSGSLGAGTNNIALGYNPTTNSGFFNGLLDEVAVYIGTTLTGAQVSANYAAGAPTSAGQIPATLTPSTGNTVNQNAYFQGGDKTGWVTVGTATFTVVGPSTIPAGAPTQYAAEVVTTATGSGIQESNTPFPAIAGDVYLIRVWVYCTSAAKTLSFGVNWLNSSHSLISSAANTVITVANAWTLYSFTSVAPSTVATAYPYITVADSSATFYVSSFFVENASGSVDFSNISGASLNAISDNGGVFVYTGDPSSGGALTGSWSAAGGSDSYGNSFTNGLTVGLENSDQINLTSDANQHFDVTTALSAVLQTIASFSTTDANEIFQGMLASGLVGTGTSERMATVLTAPGNGTSAAPCLVLEAVNDANTSNPVITAGIYTSPDNITMVYTPIMTLTEFACLIYSGAGGQNTTTLTGAGNWTAPTGVSSVKAECWGPGGGGAGGTNNVNNGLSGDGSGGGGGEYAAEPALAVTPSNNYAYSCGSGGAGGGGNSSGNNGSASTIMHGNSVTVTAHAGGGGGNINYSSGGAAGTGSSNTTHHNGGPGETSGSVSTFGSGGGGAGGSSGAGSIGNWGGSLGGGAGGAAGAGGGSGGTGGAPTGSVGNFPGGGGGGGQGWYGGLDAGGGAGAGGQIKLTYSASVPGILWSVAKSSGTDDYGNSYPAGMFISEITPSTPTAGGVFYSNGNGTPSIILPSGLSGQIPIVQTDTSVITQASTGAKNMTKDWGIPAGDPKVGTVYRLTAWGTCLAGSTPAGFDAAMNFADVNGNQALIDIVAAPSGDLLNLALGWVVELWLQCLTTGTTGSGIMWARWEAGESGPSSGDHFVWGSGTGNANFTFNTSIANSLAFAFNWTTTAGSPTMTAYGSTFERLGP